MNHLPEKRERFWPACVGAEEAAAFFGWPPHFLPILVTARHLKPLGRAAPNARKWFATCELDRLRADAQWLDKAIRIVERHVSESNRRRRSKAVELGPAPPEQEAV